MSNSLPAADVVDVHAHHYPAAFAEACLSDPDLTTRVRSDDGIAVMVDGAVSLVIPQPAPTVEERLAVLDQAGIDVQLLSVSAPNMYHFPSDVRSRLASQTNDELIEIARRSEGRLPALISLPLPDVPESLTELARVGDAPGVAGVFLCTTVQERHLDAPEFAPVLEALDRMGATVLVHPTVGCAKNLEDFALSLNLGFMAETTTCIARLLFSGTFERWPGITWVFSHLGGTMPFLNGRLAKANKAFADWQLPLKQTPEETMGALYFDTVTDHGPALRCAIDTYGASSLLFGTDYPHGPKDLRGPLNMVRSEIDDLDASAVMGATARRIFRLTQPAATEGS